MLKAMRLITSARNIHICSGIGCFSCGMYGVPLGDLAFRCNVANEANKPLKDMQAVRHGGWKAGAAILNVAGGHKTIDIVRTIRTQFPDIPVIATGGPTGESIWQTIAAGANAITFTPPLLQDMFRQTM